MPTAFSGKVLNDSMVTKPFRHHIWQEVLTRNVTSRGEVDFGKVRAHPRRLNQYLEQLQAVSPESDPSYFPSASDKTAYWLNAHNALAMRLILDAYPLSSTQTLKGLETDTAYRLGGKAYSLRQIRQKIGFEAKRDARLLFTLTDYTRSAPPILQEAYEGNRLKAQEKQAAQLAMSDPQVVQTQSGHACSALKLSPFLKGFSKGLFARPVGEGEDRDSLEEGFVPVSLTTWTDYIKPLLPPATYSRLSGRCSAQAQFLPSDKTLRQVGL